MAISRSPLFVLSVLIGLGATCDRLPERQWERGAFEPIGGKPYRLPDGLTIRYIKGYPEEVPFSLLPLQMAILNTTTRRISVKMPEGLVFSPANPEYQYMMLVQEFSYSVPPDQDTLIVLPTYGCNEMLDEPDEESDYEIHSQVWEREFYEFFTILKDKHLDNEDAVELVQDALYEITDGEGLTDSTKLALEQLP